MKDTTLKNSIAILFMIAQFGVLALAFYHAHATGGFAFEEALDSALIVVPMLAGYAIAMLRHIFLPNPHARPTRRGTTYCFMVYFLFLVLFVSLVFATQAKAHSKLDFEGYKKFLATIDTVFAMYLSLVMASLFEGHAPAPVQIGGGGGAGGAGGAGGGGGGGGGGGAGGAGGAGGGADRGDGE